MDAKAATGRKINAKIFWQGILAWGLATIFYFFDNLLNVSPSAMKPQLSLAFGLSAADLGILSSSYLWPYAMMQIPAGILMDSVGPRKVFTVASIFCAVGAGLFAYSDALLLACAARVFIGIGASFAVVGCSKLAASWFPPQRFALFVGLMVAVGFLGSAFGLATVSSIVKAFGWREAMKFAAVVGLAISGLLWVCVRNKPPVAIQEEPVEEEVKEVPLLQSIKEVIKCPQGWLVAIYAGLMFVPTLSFAGLWGIPYLVEVHGFSQESGGLLVSLVFVGWVFGGPIYGWISDHMGRRNPAMYFANITTLIVTIIIIYVQNLSYLTIASLMFLLGLFSSGFIIAFAVTREKNRAEVAGTAVGFINMLNSFSAAAFQLLIGQLLDFIARDAVVTSTGKIFSQNDYQKALLCIPIGLVIALIALLPVKETFCRPKLR